MFSCLYGQCSECRMYRHARLSFNLIVQRATTWIWASMGWSKMSVRLSDKHFIARNYSDCIQHCTAKVFRLTGTHCSNLLLEQHKFGSQQRRGRGLSSGLTTTAPKTDWLGSEGEGVCGTVHCPVVALWRTAVVSEGGCVKKGRRIARNQGETVKDRARAYTRRRQVRN